MSERNVILASVRPNTILDYLYRLRIRTNYQDPSMFTDGPDREGESERVLAALRLLSTSTLLVHELRLAQLLGRESILAAATGFLNSAPVQIDVAMRGRQGLLAQHAATGTR